MLEECMKRYLNLINTQKVSVEMVAKYVESIEGENVKANDNFKTKERFYTPGITSCK
jgi:hypothetical protein